MAAPSFAPGFADLPESLPVFPLTGAVLLPRGRLPLNIFEPRYLAMTSDALAWPRLIGMVQPRQHESTADHPELYGVGCAGWITSFSETDDGRYLITLAGLCRFRVRHELPLLRGYRRAAADWLDFADDLEPQPFVLDRERLTEALRHYLDAKGLSADFDSIAKADDEHLVNTLAMVCPFAPTEKQALLEAAGPAARADTMLTLLEMAAHAPPEGGPGARH